MAVVQLPGTTGPTSLRTALILGGLHFFIIVIAHTFETAILHLPIVHISARRAEDGADSARAIRHEQTIVAKVKLLPCPSDANKLFGHQEVQVGAYSATAAGGDIAFLSPRRFIRHAVIAPRFVGSTSVESTTMEFFYEARE